MVSGERVLYIYSQRKPWVLPLIVAAAPFAVAYFAFRLLLASFATGDWLSLSALIIALVVAFFCWLAFVTFRSVQGKDYAITITDRYLERKVGSAVQTWPLDDLHRVGLFKHSVRIQNQRDIGEGFKGSSRKELLTLVLQTSGGAIDQFKVQEKERAPFLQALRDGTGLDIEELSALGGNAPTSKPDLSEWTS